MADSTHVPVDQRWFGLDKRGLPYAVVAVALIAVLVWVVPAINDFVDWTDEVAAGDVIDMGGGVTFTPPVGWLLESGIRTSENPATPVNPSNSSATLATGGVTVSVEGSGWDGDANGLLDQVNRLRENSNADDDKLFKVTGDRSSVTSSSGIVGVAEPFTSATGDGAIYAFVIDRGADPSLGLVFTVAGAAQQLAQYRDDIDRMVASVAFTAEGSS